MLSDDLKVTDGASAGAWIRPRLGGEFGAITLQVPKGYEAYARVFHPARDAERCTARWAEVADALGRTAHREMQWHALVGSSDSFNFTDSGIAQMRTARYLLVNTVSAALWAVLFGLGAYLTGRTITGLFAGLGLVGAISVGSALLVVAILGLVRRYRGSMPIPNRLRSESGTSNDSPRRPTGRSDGGESGPDRGDTEGH